MEAATPQKGAHFGATLLAGPLFSSSPGHYLYVGAPGWNSLTGLDAGRLDRWLLLHRQPFLSGSIGGQGAGWRVGSTLALAHSSDGDGRILSGDPGTLVDGKESGRVAVLRGPTTSGPHIFQDSPVPLENPEAGDDFGHAIAVGDFNNDGYHDIAVSAPSEDLESVLRNRGFGDPEQSGIVHVYYGAAGNAEFQTGELLESPQGPQHESRFGLALASGDFDGDGYDDLAVGEPLAHAQGQEDVGEVHVFFGSGTGIQGASAQTIRPSDVGMTSTEDLEFGGGLAAADFNRNIFCMLNDTCRDDLVIGVPGYSKAAGDRGGPGSEAGYDEGAVVLVVGTSNGLSGTSSTVIQQDDLIADVVFPPENHDRFGEHLWAGNFDGIMGGDLAIGVPSDGNPGKHGVLHLVYGGSSGLQSRPGHLLHWGNTTGESRQPGDRFGAGFTAGDFDHDGQIDLAIGVPSIDAGPISRAGQVVVLFGGCLFCDGFESGSVNDWQ